MKKKLIFKSEKDSNSHQLRIPKSRSLSELSISEIQQLKTAHDSIDFQHERDLISDFITKVDNSAKQYGLDSYCKPSLLKDTKNPDSFDSKKSSKMFRQKQKYSLVQSRKQDQLCFNHDKKRKVSSKKYLLKEKSLNSKNGSSLEKRIDSEKKLKKIKINDPTTITRSPIIAPLKINFQKKPILTDLHEKPLCFVERQSQESEFSKLYHLRQDQIKYELSDINTNLHLKELPYFEEERVKSMSLANSMNNRLSNSLKKSFHEDSTTRNNSYNYFLQDKKIAVANCYYRQGILQNSMASGEPVKVYEVRRPLSLDCNYSISSITKQSPFSRDSSTGTQKTVKKYHHNMMERNKIDSSFKKQTRREGQVSMFRVYNNI